MQLLHAVTCKSVTLFCSRKCAKKKKEKVCRPVLFNFVFLFFFLIGVINEWRKIKAERGLENSGSTSVALLLTVQEGRMCCSAEPT